MERNTQFTTMLLIIISSIIFPSTIGSTHAARLIAKTMAVLDEDSGYVEVNDGRIFYESAGQGPTIIMIHDGLLHRETWNDQFGVFARNHRVIRWDRRGYGRSDVPKAPYSDLEDLHRLVKTLKVDRATLIGCSAGGLLNHAEQSDSEAGDYAT